MVGVAAELSNMLFYPLDGGKLVIKTVVAAPALAVPKVGVGAEAVCAYSVIHCNPDNALFRKSLAAEVLLVGTAAYKSAAVYVNKHGAIIGIFRCDNIEILAVLAVSKALTLSELFIEKRCRFLVVCECSLLRRAGAVFRRVENTLPRINRRRILPALSRGIFKSPDFNSVLILTAFDIAHCGIKYFSFHNYPLIIIVYMNIIP